MSFNYINQQLHLENISIDAIVKQYGTPCYIYSTAALINQWQTFSKALGSYPHQICYAVKANSNLRILSLFAKQGAGFDIVSGGELARVIKAGGKAKKSVFSGVGKSTSEISQALAADIGCFNVESHDELQRIEAQAKASNRIATIALRINPDINAHTHPYITTGTKDSKFGISEHDALDLYALAAQSKYLKIQGIACHLGSQLNTLQPFLQAINRLLIMVDQLKEQQIVLQTINIGGGLGIAYNHETVPTPDDYCKAVLNELIRKKSHLRLIIEPGRALVAKAGILVTRVEYLKRSANKHFAIVDAGMNDLLRPALYQAHQAIKEVHLNSQLEACVYDVVGPICESSDFLGKDKLLRITSGDYLAIFDSGAYGFSMSSNYNSRLRSAEVLIDKDKIHLIRSRDTLEQLWANEILLSSELTT